MNIAPAYDWLPATYGFVEYSHRYTNLPMMSGDRLFLGVLQQY